MDANASPSKYEIDSANNTAYGDPIKSCSPTINNEYKKSTSAKAEDTQSSNSRKN